MNDDSLESIATDLDQLADETAGNETRPSAEDICARARQAAKRVRAMLPMTPLVTTTTSPVTGPYVAAFGRPGGQSIQATHPRAAAQPIDYEALQKAYESTTIGNPPPPENIVTPENVDTFDPPVDDLPVDPDPANEL